MKHRLLFALAAAAAVGFAAQAQADPGGVKVGALTCNVSSGWGIVFGSSKDLDCTFANGGAAVVGASANALVGGSNNSIALQPVSIEGTTGLNVAAGVASITLHAAP